MKGAGNALARPFPSNVPQDLGEARFVKVCLVN
jgi:hypothetical protein